jgi:hypothetical protein
VQSTTSGERLVDMARAIASRHRSLDTAHEHRSGESDECERVAVSQSPTRQSAVASSGDGAPTSTPLSLATTR